jgi:hypothetical protein
VPYALHTVPHVYFFKGISPPGNVLAIIRAAILDLNVQEQIKDRLATKTNQDIYIFFALRTVE